ncbi:hypothetical protein QA601_01045 [Chitinispirillales bacterium ANBcel5]|uniref:hypothetical protein n=1 Tax=Cellulosispirillum alkaliphilum TaxID=3039283 RepID=UPI002A586536|nr:hypothetical protein [Chitinispirillales bacterium ANBcel5]
MSSILLFTRFQFINWIKYYSYDEQTGEFSLEWEDNFETFDSSRWNRATHVIENSTQFDPENVINKDGKLILALTDSDGNGLDNIEVPQDEDDQGTSVINRAGNRSKSTSFYTVSVLGNTMNISTNFNEQTALNVDLLDIRGRKITTLLDRKMINGGVQRISIDMPAQFLGSKVYLARFTTPQESVVKRVIGDL